jgi:hypothetical protein
MQTIWKRFHHAYSLRGGCAALLSVLTILLFAATANAVAQTSIIISQNTKYSAFPGGGALSGEDPAGGSMAVNSLGVVVAGDTYNHDVVEFAPPAFTPTKITPNTNANVSAVAIDSSGFLFVADQYNNNIIKVPMNANGTYTITVNTEDNVSTLPACLGDTKGDATVPECLIGNPGTTLGAFGVSAMTFSSGGALFFATDDNLGTPATGTVPYTIFECNSLCLYGTTAPVLIYAEPVQAPGLVATDGQYYIGGLALDPNGNLFFTDSAEEDGNLKSAESRLNELPVVTAAINSTKFAAVPIPILTFTNASPGDYDNAIDAVATDTSGHLYISIIYSGIYGLVDNASLNGSDTGAATVAGSSLYGIANQDQAKLLTSDNSGNFYVLGNGSGDTLYFISTGPVKFPGAETVGTAENISAVVADNTEACTPTLTFTSPDTAFTGVITTSGTCSGMYQVAGSFTPVTLTYTPTATGFVASTLAVNDTTSSTSSAPQIVSSSGAAITISQGTWGAKLPGGGAFGSPAPDGHTGAINSKGVVVFGDSYGNQITLYNLVNGVTTLFGGTTTAPGVAGPYNGGGGVAIDHTDNLFMSSEYGSTIYKVAPNTDGSYGPWTADSNTNPLNAGGTAPVACVGGAADVTAGICAISLGAGNYNFGVAGMAVDTNGNLFFTSDNQASGSSGTYAPDTVWECKTTCLYGASSGNIVALYTEPIGGSGNPQLIPGSIALDSSDNVYFTDASVKGTEQSVYSDVYELPVNASNADGYANNPTLLVALPETCGSLSGCNYSTAITTVSVDANGDVFFGGPNDGSGHIGGLFKLAKNSGTLSSVPLAVSAEAPKTIVPGGNGNFYFVAYNGGDDTGYITLGSVAVTPVAQPSAPATVTNVWAIDNNADCYADQGNLTFTEAANDGFSAIETAGNNCTTLPFGSGVSFPVSVTFTPTASATGTVTTTITATNSNSGDTGTASVTGQAATAQPITGFSGIASSVVYGGGPYTLSATGGASGNPLVFSVDHSSTAAATATGTNGTTLTITGVGTVVIDINQAGTTTGSPIYAPGYLQVMITVTAAPQTITFAPTSPVTYTATPIALVATGGASGNPVTFTATGPGTITGTAAAPTLTLSGVGTVVVTASQAASTSGDYAAATPVVAHIVVNAIAQTITFAPTSPVTYTATPIALVATGGASGNPVTFTATGPGTITGTAAAPTLTLSGVGTVVVTASQAASTNGDYAAATPVVANIVVNAITQTITFAPTSPVIYTTTPIALVATGGASGNAVTFAVTSGPGTITGTATAPTLTLTGVGTVVVTASQAASTNGGYSAATPVAASIVVNADPQTITISASPTTVTAPSTSTITATASSGLPVTLAITTGSNIATLSGTTLTPTGTAFGNVTVTGTQTGNSIYAAATAATVTVLVNSAATVATPVITPASGTTLVIGSNNTVTIADTTANAVILYTTDGSSPLTSTTATKYTGAITLSTAGSVTVSAAATLLGDTPSAVVTATYTVTTVLPTFTISASPSSATVTNTTPASIAITVAPSVTFTAPITFACSGGQPNVGCTFSPASITPPATTTTTLTVSFGATAALRHGPNPFLPGGVTFAIALGFLGWKKRRNMLLALALIAGVVGLVQLTGCGGSTAPTVSTVTVTATGGGVTQTLPLTITVRQ